MVSNEVATTLLSVEAVVSTTIVRAVLATTIVSVEVVVTTTIVRTVQWWQ